MKNPYFILLLILVISLNFTSCSTNETMENSSKKETVSAVYEYNELEKQLIIEINNYRLKNGLNTLIVDNYVSLVSESHAKYMIDKNIISHDLFNIRYLNIVNTLNATKVSENVASNFTSSQNTLNAWLKSPIHKINIDGDFTHFGISVKTSPTGINYYTNIFMKK